MKRHTAALKIRRRERPGEQNEWQLQEAKARFSEVFRRARSRGPQRVTRHGKEAVMVIPAEEYDRFSRRQRQGSLVEFFVKSPLVNSGVKLDRVPDYGRLIDV